MHNDSYHDESPAYDVDVQTAESIDLAYATLANHDARLTLLGSVIHGHTDNLARLMADVQWCINEVAKHDTYEYAARAALRKELLTDYAMHAANISKFQGAANHKFQRSANRATAFSIIIPIVTFVILLLMKRKDNGL
jgi:hypothetical protein